MKIEMQCAKTAQGLVHSGWDVVLRGDALDSRGTAALAFAHQNAPRVLECDYSPQTFELNINGAIASADDTIDLLRPFQGARLLLEATTLGFAEVFLICRALLALKSTSVTLVYVEPNEYSAPNRKSLLKRRDFELSDEVPGYIPIPGALILLGANKPQRGVFFLGYEARRLEQALEDHPISSSKACVVFGVPAFQAGWEMNAFANNLRVMLGRRVRGGVHFCGAQSPYAAYEALERIKQECQAGEQLFVAPVGTKPHGIGAALFAAKNPGVGILYDHPQRRAKRTIDLAAWHLFEVTL